MKTILLLGHPNAGKTTLFNCLTGSNFKTVNYPGSTIDFEKGFLKSDKNNIVIDVPGIESLNSQSEDEKIALSSLFKLNNLIPNAKENPDLILFVADATQRSRHLAMAKQIIDLGLPTIIVMNMADLADKQEKRLDESIISEHFNTPVIYIDGRHNKNIKPLIDLCDKTLQSEKALQSTVSHNDINNLPKKNYTEIESLIQKASLKKKNTKTSFDFDSIFLHWLFGPLCFFSVMSLFFFSIFSLAAPLMDIVDILFSNTIVFLADTLPNHWLSQLLSEGIIGGIGSALVFVPQIAILFLGIGILEGSGYLARGAVIVDRFLAKIGLSGKSFVPLLSGCACAIPALMAARHIPRQKERILCMFIIPLMQCSARLPVYGLLLGLLFINKPWLSGLGLTAIYIASVILSSIISVIGAKILGIKENDDHFNIELPNWKTPIIKNLWSQTYHQTKSFITEAGPIIVLISIVLWLLSAFPSEQHSFAMMIGQFIEPLFLPMGIDWRVGVAILVSFAAREVFVSALVVMFSLGAESTMLASLQKATFQGTDTLIFTPPTILGLIVFFMIALQCGTTVAVARKEMGGWKLPLIQLGTYISLAYALAILINILL